MIILNNDRKYLSKFEKNLIKNSLNNFEILAFPTDTTYGIGVNGSSKKAVSKIYKLKRRDDTKPLILLTYSKNELLKYIKYPELLDNEIVKKYWPGPLTIIFEIKNNINLYYSKEEINTLGIRIPNNPLMLDLLEFIQLPLVTTSANLSRENPLYDGYEIEKKLNYKNHKISIIIEDGVIKNNPSTIISLGKDKIVTLRKSNLII